jgi:hypothetical protein
MCVLKYINVDTFVGKMWVVWWVELYLNLHIILIQQSHQIVEELVYLFKCLPRILSKGNVYFQLVKNQLIQQ